MKTRPEAAADVRVDPPLEQTASSYRDGRRRSTLATSGSISRMAPSPRPPRSALIRAFGYTRDSCGTTLRGKLRGSDRRRRRRRPEGAARSMHQSREAHHTAWPLHSPKGHDHGIRRYRPVKGTWVASVDIRVGISGLGLGRGGAGSGPAGLRSLPAKQHAPKARPSPATDRGRRGMVPGSPSRTNGCTVRTCAAAGCRTFALDGRASRPAGTTSLPASLVASMPGGGVSPRTPSSEGGPG